MKRWIHASRNTSRAFVVDADEAILTNNSIKLPVGTRGDYPVRYRISFPLRKRTGEELISFKILGDKIKVTIPDWLLQRKKEEGKLSYSDSIIQASSSIS